MSKTPKSAVFARVPWIAYYNIMQQKKKILFLSTKSVLGGAQRYVIDLVQYLPKDSFECIVAAGGHGPFAVKIADLDIPYFEIKSLARDINPLLEIAAFFELFSLFRKTLPDIIHLNSSKASFIGAIAGRLAGIKKIISSTHGWPFLEDRPRWQRRWQKKKSRYQNLKWLYSQFPHLPAKQPF